MSDIKGVCDSFRKLLKDFAPAVLEFNKHIQSQPELTMNKSSEVTANKGEMLANIELAYRHLEDASMRFGKVIQAYEGGKSPLDNSLGQK